MTHLTGLTPEALAAIITDSGQPKYRVRQLLDWIYQKSVFSPDGWTNLPAGLRTALPDMPVLACRELQRRTAADGTVKFAWELDDGHLIESVLIPMETDRWTFCISSQVGCAMGCRFCNTARMGFIRNLTPAEIVSQVLLLRKAAGLQEKTAFNVVFMGMGEPLLNVNHVMTALRILTAEEALNMSPRRITVSTCGIISGLNQLAQGPIRPRIALSLNAADEETRRQIMPVTEGNPLPRLINTLRNFPLANRERFTMEYVLIRDVNDSVRDARNVVRLLNGLRYKINLIPFNPFPGSPFQAPITAAVERFQQVLLDKHVTAIVRKSKGADIQGACGQLATACRKANGPAHGRPVSGNTSTG